MVTSTLLFPTKWLPLLKEMCKRIEDGALNNRFKLISESPRKNDSFTEIVAEIDDPIDLIMAGYWMGFHSLSTQIQEEAMPKVMENIDKLVNQIKAPSDN